MNGESFNSQNTDHHRDCASQTSGSHQHCCRIMWDFILTEMANRILEQFVSVGDTNKESIEQRCTSLLDSILCVGGRNAIANEAWATKISKVWDPMTFIDKFDITGRPVQFHWHICSGHTRLQVMHERNSNILGIHGPCGSESRIIFMSTEQRHFKHTERSMGSHWQRNDRYLRNFTSNLLLG